MGKKLNLNKSVYELVQEYPELVDILKDLGFTEITKPAMLNSVGRMTTIPKGAKMKNISMMKVVPALMSNGFDPVGKMPNIFGLGRGKHAEERNGQGDSQQSLDGAADGHGAASEPDSVTEQLKGYLRRLGVGEDLESVREDFAEHFSEVDASEIMKAEQELMREGTPLTEVQKLCDVHSALFHGATREERIANAEKAAAEAYKNKHEAAKALRETAGHPIYTWTLENERIGALIHEMQQDLEENRDAGEKLSELRQLAVHYAKKGDLVYPVLKVRYEISGPSDVMWTVDDEIRDELAALDKQAEHDEGWNERLKAVLVRADEMIYKEANILFPICAVNFTEEEWYGIYEDAKDYALVFGVEARWDAAEAYNAEKKAKNEAALNDGEIVLAGGHMTLPQLEALLNTLPIEITFVDADNINRFFNEGPKVFKRPQMAIDREVFSCHPPKIEPMVRMILQDFRDHKRDQVPVWMEKNGKPFLVTYMAVRDKKGNYLGTVEVVQDMQFAKEHFEEK